MLKLSRITKTLGRLSILLSICLVSCVSTESYSGTIGARHRIDPFPVKEEWVSISKKISKETSFKPALLWQVGIYYNQGVRLSFPGQENRRDKLYFSEVDFGKEYINYFDKKGIDVFLTIEPGSASTRTGIHRSLNNYKENKSIKGICIDYEWVEEGVTKREIQAWRKMVSVFNPNHYLMFKHWKIGEIPAVAGENIVYLNSMEGVKNREDLLKRADLWYRHYYPAKIGFIIGYKKDQKLWANYTIQDFKNDLDSRDIKYNFIFWSETNLDIID